MLLRCILGNGDANDKHECYKKDPIPARQLMFILFCILVGVGCDGVVVFKYS